MEKHGCSTPPCMGLRRSCSISVRNSIMGSGQVLAFNSIMESGPVLAFFLNFFALRNVEMISTLFLVGLPVLSGL